MTTPEIAAPVIAQPQAARPEIVVHEVKERPRGWTSWLTTTDH
ncbi:MAG: hypothetical protein QOF37_1443 [Thermoleophilaceae bacterium]|nr:hypothetical protein [Thermoleophilaceae bacterium]